MSLKSCFKACCRLCTAPQASPVISNHHRCSLPCNHSEKGISSPYETPALRDHIPGIHKMYLLPLEACASCKMPGTLIFADIFQQRAGSLCKGIFGTATDLCLSSHALPFLLTRMRLPERVSLGTLLVAANHAPAFRAPCKAH